VQRPTRIPRTSAKVEITSTPVRRAITIEHHNIKTDLRGVCASTRTPSDGLADRFDWRYVRRARKLSTATGKVRAKSADAV
jgi:hypothetical protein